MAFPVETVTWLKDGVALTTNERVVVKTLSEPESLSVGPAGGGATHRVATHRVALVIVSVQREDAGMYQCVATNEDQQTQAAAQLDLGGEFMRFECGRSRTKKTVGFHGRF